MYYDVYISFTYISFDIECDFYYYNCRFDPNSLSADANRYDDDNAAAAAAAFNIAKRFHFIIRFDSCILYYYD